MKRTFSKYANQVVVQLPCNRKTKKRIREDIIEMLEERSEGSNWEEEQDPEALLGNPSELAAEFMENLDTYGVSGVKSEWISDTMILGLPLYHIVAQHSRSSLIGVNNQPVRIAKGIIAIGPVAVGGIAVGGVSAGIVSLGGISFGILSFGGLALGVLGALGGVAMANDMALGGIAIANNLAIGGLAIAKEVAIGGVTTAKLMLYSQSYNMPNQVDQGSVYAFNHVYSGDFLAKFKELYKDFGLIKQGLIQMFS